MFSHPGLLVHLVLDVAEGPADFGHAFSLSVGPKRPGFLLWYADSQTQNKCIYINIYFFFFTEMFRLARFPCLHNSINSLRLRCNNSMENHVTARGPPHWPGRISAAIKRTWGFILWECVCAEVGWPVRDWPRGAGKRPHTCKRSGENLEAHVLFLPSIQTTSGNSLEAA